MDGYFFKFYSSGQYWFNLKSNNHKIILKSEGYTSSSARDNGIQSVRDNSPLDSRYERKVSVNSQYFFNLKASNGQIIGTSETYTTRAAREEGIEDVKRIAATAGEKSGQVL